jgi:hypothetical protein
MLLGVFLYIAFYGLNIPWADEWSYIPIIIGNQPTTVRWLWAQHNEHRMMLPKLIWVTLGKLTSWDMRAGMYLNALLLGGLAMATILAANKARGHMRYTDAFFPLMLLNVGQSESLFWSLMVSHVLPICLTGAFLLIILLKGVPRSWLGAVLAGLGLIALSLSGGEGVFFSLVLALFLGGVALRSWWFSSDVQSKRVAWINLVSAAVTLCLSGLYFIGYEKPHFIPKGQGLGPSLRASLEALCVSFGHAEARAWWPFLGIGVLTLIGASLAALAWLWWHQSSGRMRILGLLVFLGTHLVLLVAAGFSRSGWGVGIGFQARYGLLIAPAMFAVYFIWDRLPIRTLQGLVPMCLFALALITFLPNVNEGLEIAQKRKTKMNEFDQDIRQGIAPNVLAERYYPLIDFDPPSASWFIGLLVQAKIGPFGRWGEDVPGGAPSLSASTAPPPAAPGSIIPYYLAPVVDGRTVAGWAWDKDHSDETVQVDVFDGETLLATVPADKFDQEFVDAGLGNGRHGFFFFVPERLQDGKPHVIGAKIAGTGVHLANSPQTVVLKGP